jgi:hypothetical protein
MPLKAFLAIAALMAIVVGLMLPTPNRTPEAQVRSQIPTIEVGPG